MANFMAKRVSIAVPWLIFAWLAVGVLVAINKDYAQSFDSASRVATFVLAVVLWPIPATDGVVLIQFSS